MMQDLDSETLHSVLRSLLIAGAALPIAALVCRALRDRGRAWPRLRPWLWALLFAPFFTPALVVGYAYPNFALSLVRLPLWNELAYGVLVVVRLVPLVALILFVAPSAVSREARHCRELLFGRGPSRISLWFRDAGWAWLAAATLAFILAFGEFEIASFFGVPAWTVALFDAQVGGLSLAASLRLAAAPLLCQLFALAALLGVLAKRTRQRAVAATASPAAGLAIQAGAWLYLGLALAVGTAIPAAFVLRDTASGLGSLLRSFSLTGEIVTSAAMGAAAAALATWTAARLLRRNARSRGYWPTILVACAPGLTGSLLLSMLLLRLFDWPPLSYLRDSPWPWLLSLGLLLLPAAVALCLVRGVRRPGEALHGAHLLAAGSASRRRAAELLWALDGRVSLWIACALFFWANFDLLASSVLAPPGLTPVTVRLYNFMHYDRSAILSAMLTVAALAPIAICLLFGLVGKRASLRRRSAPDVRHAPGARS